LRAGSSARFGGTEDFARLDQEDAELLLSTIEWGGKGSNPDKVKWFRSPQARLLMGKMDWMEFPKAVWSASDGVKAYIYANMPNWSRELLRKAMDASHPTNAEIRKAEKALSSIANEMVAAGVINLKPTRQDLGRLTKRRAATGGR